MVISWGQVGRQKSGHDLSDQLRVSYIFQVNFGGSVSVKGKYFHDRQARTPTVPLLVRTPKNTPFLLNSGMPHYRCGEALVIPQKGFWQLCPETLSFLTSSQQPVHSAMTFKAVSAHWESTFLLSSLKGGDSPKYPGGCEMLSVIFSPPPCLQLNTNAFSFVGKLTKIHIFWKSISYDKRHDVVKMCALPQSFTLKVVHLGKVGPRRLSSKTRQLYLVFQSWTL